MEKNKGACPRLVVHDYLNTERIRDRQWLVVIFRQSSLLQQRSAKQNAHGHINNDSIVKSAKKVNCHFNDQKIVR